MQHALAGESPNFCKHTQDGHHQQWPRLKTTKTSRERVSSRRKHLPRSQRGASLPLASSPPSFRPRPAALAGRGHCPGEVEPPARRQFWDSGLHLNLSPSQGGSSPAERSWVVYSPSLPCPHPHPHKGLRTRGRRMSPCPCGQHNLEFQVYKSLAGGGVGEGGS